MFCDYISCCKKWARCSFTLHERLSWTDSWEWKIYRSMHRLTLSSEHQIWKFHVQQTTGSLRSYEGNCNKNVLCLKLNALQLFHVGHFYKKAEVSVLSLYCRCNWFSCREEKNERSSSIKYENFTSFSADYDKTFHQKACHTGSTIIYPHSTNHDIDLWRCRRSTLPSSLVEWGKVSVFHEQHALWNSNTKLPHLRVLIIN